MPIHIDSSVLTRLEQLDPDRVRAARMADPDIRDRLLTLYAFHAELAKVPELVSEPMMGAIRYQWWRDALGEMFDGRTVRAHEVTTPLAEMIAQTGISRFLLDRIIDGRERDLDPQPFATIHDGIDYADATSGALARAAVFLCGGQGGLMAGRAWGMTGLARSYRYYTQGILSGLAFEDIADAAKSAYSEARKDPLGPAIPALAYGALVPGFLKRMARPGYDPASNVPDYSPFAKQLRMLGTVATGRL